MHIIVLKMTKINRCVFAQIGQAKTQRLFVCLSILFIYIEMIWLQIKPYPRGCALAYTSRIRL